jgi:hypothetical protein
VTVLVYIYTQLRMFRFGESSTKAKALPSFLWALLSTSHAPFQYMPQNSKGSHCIYQLPYIYIYIYIYIKKLTLARAHTHSVGMGVCLCVCARTRRDFVWVWEWTAIIVFMWNDNSVFYIKTNKSKILAVCCIAHVTQRLHKNEI